MKFHLVPKLSCNKKVTYDVVTKAFFNFTLHMTIELGNTMWINFWELQLIKKLPNFVIWLQIRKLEIFIRQSSNFWQHSKDHYRKCYTRFVYLSYPHHVRWNSWRSCLTNYKGVVLRCFFQSYTTTPKML